MQGPTPESFIALLGGFPEVGAAETVVLDSVEEAGYTRRLIEYTTAPGERVKAFLLAPKGGPGRRPGILAIHQDGGRRPYEFGKSEPAGLGGREAALRPGTLPAGLRRTLPGSVRFREPQPGTLAVRRAVQGLPHLHGRGLELTEDLYKGCVANRLLFDGRTPLGVELHELRCALNCLAAQPGVDQRRIGAIGHSAGGGLTALLMYVDPRVRVGVASCGTWLSRWNWGPHGALRPINGFAGAVAPGLGRWGDQDDILAGLAPRPYLETRGDPAPPGQVAELIGKAGERYAASGVPEHFAYLTYDAGHTFRRDMRERSYAWFDQFLVEDVTMRPARALYRVSCDAAIGRSGR